ncbi:hypothetical protein K438DRAFT_1993663 [Mycena galopus ATCC 62051]|nr:hypothetical protein K438DRAFT_1993663 [Mycena galopus ATCC 62051]
MGDGMGREEVRRAAGKAAHNIAYARGYGYEPRQWGGEEGAAEVRAGSRGGRTQWVCGGGVMLPTREVRRSAEPSRVSVWTQDAVRTSHKDMAAMLFPDRLMNHAEGRVAQQKLPTVMKSMGIKVRPHKARLSSLLSPRCLAQHHPYVVPLWSVPRSSTAYLRRRARPFAEACWAS